MNLLTLAAVALLSCLETQQTLPPLGRTAALLTKGAPLIVPDTGHPLLGSMTVDEIHNQSNNGVIIGVALREDRPHSSVTIG